MFETCFGFVPASVMMPRALFLGRWSRVSCIRTTWNACLTQPPGPVLDPQNPRVVGVPGSPSLPIPAGGSDAHKSLRTRSPELSRNRQATTTWKIPRLGLLQPLLRGHGAELTLQGQRTGAERGTQEFPLPKAERGPRAGVGHPD